MQRSICNNIGMGRIDGWIDGIEGRRCETHMILLTCTTASIIVDAIGMDMNMQ